MNFMTNFSRLFEAKNLYNNLDTWLADKLKADDVEIAYSANGNITVMLNNQVVSTSTNDRLRVKCESSNQLDVIMHDNHCSDFTINNFDIMPFLRQSTHFEFTMPFVLCYNELVAAQQTTKSKLLADNMISQQQVQQLEQKILQALTNLKY